MIRPNDQRWRPIERQEMAAATVDQFRDFYTPLLAAGPVHAIIVGDIGARRGGRGDAAHGRRAAARPRRHGRERRSAAARPRPNPEPRTFTHQGDPNQAYALIGWSTLGGTRPHPRAARAGARRQHLPGPAVRPAARGGRRDLFARRLPSRLRDLRRLGHFLRGRRDPARHAPTPSSAPRARSSPTSPRSRSRPTSSRARRTRSISGIERRLATNGYWIDALENWDRDPRDIENVRSYLADYRALTAEDVRRAVAT